MDELLKRTEEQAIEDEKNQSADDDSTLENLEKEPIHDYAKHDDLDQVRYMSGVLNTIDSLESMKVDMEKLAENTNMVLSYEQYQYYLHMAEMIHKQNGLDYNHPFFISTEHFSPEARNRFKTMDTLAFQFDQQIETLSTEANHFFARMWRGFKETFGREFNRVERIKDDILTLISELEGKPDWGLNDGGALTVKNAPALTIQGRFDLPRVMDLLSQGNKYLEHGNFMEKYYQDIQTYIKTLNNAQWGDREKLLKSMTNKNIFSLPKPFVEDRDGPSHDGYTKYTLRVSDLNALIINMPKGNLCLIPTATYDNNSKAPVIFSGKAKAKDSYDQTVPIMPRRELLKQLHRFVEILNRLPNASEFNSIAGKLKKQMEFLTDQSLALRNHHNEIKEWNNDDWEALAGAIAIPVVVFLVLGVPGVFGLSIGKAINNVVDLVSQIGSDDAEMNVHRNTYTNHNKFLVGGTRGIKHTLINGLWLKRYVNSCENKLTLYFIGVYREYYAILKSTGNALISYGYASLGQSNKH